MHAYTHVCTYSKTQAARVGLQRCCGAGLLLVRGLQDDRQMRKKEHVGDFKHMFWWGEWGFTMQTQTPKHSQNIQYRQNMQNIRLLSKTKKHPNDVTQRKPKKHVKCPQQLCADTAVHVHACTHAHTHTHTHLPPHTHSICSAAHRGGWKILHIFMHMQINVIVIVVFGRRHWRRCCSEHCQSRKMSRLKHCGVGGCGCGCGCGGGSGVGVAGGVDVAIGSNNKTCLFTWTAAVQNGEEKKMR